MRFLRSDRAAAVLLLGAAALGLLLANTPAAPFLHAVDGRPLPVPPLGLDLTAGDWISEGLLAIFFFLVAVELRHELTVGELNSPAKAVRPAIAAAGGVLVPAVLYLAVTAASGRTAGWPVPTATDIAFALGVLAMFGRGLPARVRVFLLALAVLDDLGAILIIAVFFAGEVDLPALGFAAIGVGVFHLLSRVRHRSPGLVAAAMVLAGIATWICVARSGVHPTIAGVVLGLVTAPSVAHRARRMLEPWSNGLILPLFAFSAALVPIPRVPVTELSAPFWGILLALPVGKFLGIALGGWIGSLIHGQAHPPLPRGDLAVVAVLGGIGFTVSLLMNDLAFAGSPTLVDQGTLAVLAGSAVAILAASVVVRSRARHYRRLA